jgi:hypothetical protein
MTVKKIQLNWLLAFVLWEKKSISPLTSNPSSAHWPYEAGTVHEEASSAIGEGFVFICHHLIQNLISQ